MPSQCDRNAVFRCKIQRNPNAYPVQKPMQPNAIRCKPNAIQCASNARPLRIQCGASAHTMRTDA
eukprot:3640876-Lingulodinium_polyedra.AAC.1